MNLSLLLKGTEEEQLMWVFRLYDINGDGVLSRFAVLITIIIIIIVIIIIIIIIVIIIIMVIDGQYACREEIEDVAQSVHDLMGRRVILL